MQQTWEYIEAYFTQALSAEERKTFEVRCAEDAAFAKEVAFYLTARSAAREVLIAEKQKSFAERAMPQQVMVKTALIKKMALRKWISYVAAACIILFVGAYFILKSPAPQQLASQYVKVHFTILSQTMDASRDSLQLGIAAYNSQDYQRALMLFEGVRRNDAANSDAKKYAGLAYLQTKNYDKALECFKELSGMKGLYSNSGDFLQAVTLLQRNNPGDKESAKALLQKVVQENKEGSKQASEWLAQW
ncbi:tetratricopeptide repeat protein [Ilyomonas limi]|uniref:Tetratricopeptide repeat protein n=1 Tax=Ilyomonas limi TaxID=2575867 RepID=A0A4U3KXB4_9BACT|nr:tetratricopeptide repeat protein [Ilyomonas limi]TKK67261.1 tetratricopeptide repeat protein [Ilyomonas limi]